MQKTRITVSLLFLAFLCGRRQLPAQEAQKTPQDDICSLQTKMDELKAQLAEIQSELDAIQGANFGVSVRVPQARYSLGIGDGASGCVSIEVPSSSIEFSVAGAAATPITPVRDGAFRLRKEWESGHIQLASVFRGPWSEAAKRRARSTL